jgi:Uncharacterized protein involved in formate dehydrogenase formation
MILFPWDLRIARAEELAGTCPSATEMLRFYAEIARFQKRIFELQPQDESALVSQRGGLVSLVRRVGPAPLDSDLGAVKQFYERCLLQPYYEYRASQTQIQNAVQPTCPFCGEKPQVGVLRGEGDGAKRSLICSLCSTEWDFRRLLCANCGEEDPVRLPVYTAEEFPHVRIEACDSCEVYIKAVDLSKNGRAVPVVDELASLPLNIWAAEHGYTKLQLNLLEI